MTGLMGKKLGMTQYFDDNGRAVPVTVIQAGPCVVVQRKTEERDGYSSVQLGYGEVSPNKITKPLRGHFEKAGVSPRRHLKEFRLNGDDDELEPGDELRVDAFEAGDLVDVTGKSKGKGFTGTIKRHNFASGPKSHGSRFKRAPGSLGASADPAHVFKGTRLPGRKGNETVTIIGLEVVKVDPERDLLLVKGSVPGARDSLVYIRESVRAG